MANPIPGLPVSMPVLALGGGLLVGAMTGITNGTMSFRRGQQAPYYPGMILGGAGVVAGGAGLLLKNENLAMGGMMATTAGAAYCGATAYIRWDAKDGELGNQNPLPI